MCVRTRSGAAAPHPSRAGLGTTTIRALADARLSSSRFFYSLQGAFSGRSFEHNFVARASRPADPLSRTTILIVQQARKDTHSCGDCRYTSRCL
jgi:hypothetical protein